MWQQNETSSSCTNAQNGNKQPSMGQGGSQALHPQDVAKLYLEVDPLGVLSRLNFVCTKATFKRARKIKAAARVEETSVSDVFMRVHEAASVSCCCIQTPMICSFTRLILLFWVHQQMSSPDSRSTRLESGSDPPHFRLPLRATRVRLNCSLKLPRPEGENEVFPECSCQTFRGVFVLSVPTHANPCASRVGLVMTGKK